MLQITPQERVALQLLANGKSTNEIAGRLGIRDYEVDGHLTTLFTRMGVASQAEGIAAAFRRGLLTAEASGQLDRWR